MKRSPPSSLPVPRTLALLLSLSVSPGLAVEAVISEPAVKAGLQVTGPEAQRAEEIVVNSPDRHVPTLGQVEYRIDWTSQHDSLRQKEIRDAALSLADGRPANVFAFDEAAGLIVAAADPVAAITLAGVHERSAGARDILATFHDAGHHVIAPDQDDIAVFELGDHARLAFDYAPMIPPERVELPVDLLLDNSASMSGQMHHVLASADAFVQALPDFTGCRIRTFNSTIQDLTPVTSEPLSCPDTGWYLGNRGIEAAGGTALYQAILESLARGDGAADSTAIAQLSIVVTDGMDTASKVTLTELLAAKRAAPKSKVLVFWIGTSGSDALHGVADFELSSTQDLKGELDAFFASINVTVRGLQTLRVPDGPPSS